MKIIIAKNVKQNLDNYIIEAFFWGVINEEWDSFIDLIVNAAKYSKIMEEMLQKAGKRIESITICLKNNLYKRTIILKQYGLVMKALLVFILEN